MIKHYIVALLLSLAVVGHVFAAEPERAKGLSVHMLPDRVAQIDGRSGGFSVRNPNSNESIYSDAQALIAFFQTLSASRRENGIWVITTHPSAYTETERAMLKTLIAACDEKKIPIFTCRGSELPNGWKRSQIPAGWE